MPKKKPKTFLGIEDIKFPKPKPIKIPSVGSLLRGEIGEEKRVRIPSTTKKAVYERAEGRCESCGRPMKMTDKGVQFHHTRKPTVKSRPTTIQFLCATCHRQHGHDFNTITKKGTYGETIKETKIKRKKVRKHKSPYWKEKPKTRKTKKVTRTRKKTR